MFLEACFVSFVVRWASSSYISNAIAASVVNIVLAVAGTILNSFVIQFIYWKSPKLRSKLSSFAIILLCSIDLGVGTVVHSLFALKSITMLDSPKCLYIMASDIAILFFSGILAYTIFIINVERYFAMIHPFLYRIDFTKRRFVLTWVFFWFFDVVWIVYCVYFTFLAILIPVTLCIIVFTFVVARKKMLKRNRNTDLESRRNLMVFLRELKMAKTYVLIVSYASFVTCQPLFMEL